MRANAYQARWVAAVTLLPGLEAARANDDQPVFDRVRTMPRLRSASCPPPLRWELAAI